MAEINEIGPDGEDRLVLDSVDMASLSNEHRTIDPQDALELALRHSGLSTGPKLGLMDMMYDAFERDPDCIELPGDAVDYAAAIAPGADPKMLPIKPGVWARMVFPNGARLIALGTRLGPACAIEKVNEASETGQYSNINFWISPGLRCLGLFRKDSQGWQNQQIFKEIFGYSDGEPTVHQRVEWIKEELDKPVA